MIHEWGNKVEKTHEIRQLQVYFIFLYQNIRNLGAVLLRAFKAYNTFDKGWADWILCPLPGM
jgi:hypothetical protein